VNRHPIGAVDKLASQRRTLKVLCGPRRSPGSFAPLVAQQQQAAPFSSLDGVTQDDRRLPLPAVASVSRKISSCVEATRSVLALSRGTRGVVSATVCAPDSAIVPVYNSIG